MVKVYNSFFFFLLKSQDLFFFFAFSLPCFQRGGPSSDFPIVTERCVSLACVWCLINIVQLLQLSELQQVTKASLVESRVFARNKQVAQSGLPLSSHRSKPLPDRAGHLDRAAAS